MKHFITFFIAVFLYGCHSGEKKDSGDISVFRLENSDSRLLSAVIDSVSFLPLIEQDSFLFGRVDKLIMQGEYIYLMDIWVSNSLLVFDRTGAFVRKIGKRGGGPGEYNRLEYFDVDSEHIYLYDGQKRQILKYDLRGNFIETKKTPFHACGFKILKNRKYLFALDQYSGDEYQIVRTDLDFNVEASFVPFPFEYDDRRGFMGRYNILQTVDDLIFYNSHHSDTVYSFSNEGDFTGGVLFDFGQKALPERFRRDIDEFVESTEGRNYNYFDDTPFKVNQVWIGRMVNEGKSATFMYDNTSDKYYFYHNNLDYASVDTPMFVNSKYIVGSMDIGGYNYVKNKPPLNSSAMAVLEDGGHILTFYHLKQNGK